MPDLNGMEVKGPALQPVLWTAARPVEIFAARHVLAEESAWERPSEKLF